MEKSFAYGVTSAVQVMEAIRDEIRADRQYQKSRYDQVVQLILLNRWSGTLGDDDIQQVNGWLSNVKEAPAVGGHKG